MAENNDYNRKLNDGDEIIWEITKDIIEDGSDNNKTNVPVDLMLDYEHKMIHRFKIYDDDGELYYEGRATNQSYENAFEPLDWAMANAGCTEIKYQNNETKKWETL